jgi:hypothetical protein
MFDEYRAYFHTGTAGGASPDFVLGDDITGEGAFIVPGIGCHCPIFDKDRRALEEIILEVLDNLPRT